jgi:Replication-relaxation
MREEKILFALSKLDCLKRSQLQMILGIPDVRMMNKILYRMSRYLHHVYLDEYVYYLNKKGRELVGAEREFKKNSRIEHHLMRNDIYIFYHYPKDWVIERPVTWKEDGKEHKLIPDARFTYHDTMYFVEVDSQQQMIKNHRKIKQYASLFRVMQRQNVGEPILLWYTVSHDRKEKLEQWCKEYGVSCEVLCKQDF